MANVLPNRRMNPAAGGGLVADWRPGSPAAGYAGRYAKGKRNPDRRGYEGNAVRLRYLGIGSPPLSG